MEIARRTYFNIVLTLCVAVSVIQCSPKSYEPPRGTQIGGGGTIFSSTPEQVNAALDKALDLATQTEPSKNVIVQFWNSMGRLSNNDHIKKPAHLLPKINSPIDSEPADLFTDVGQFDSPYLAALKINKVTRLSSGDCLKSATLTRHTDASVSAFNVHADICFSIGNLTRIPPSTLLREILSLVLHEAVHLGGGDEDEAVDWQQEFTAYFGARFGDLETDHIETGTKKLLGEAKGLLTKAQELALLDSKDPRIFEAMGKLSDKLLSLPYFRDPLALELKMKPLQPQLISNYSNAVLALIEKIHIKFEIKSDVINANGLHIPIDFMPANQVVPTLNGFEKYLEQIEDNFSAFLGGSAAARSVCVLPDGVNDLNILPIDKHGWMRPVSLPRKCAPTY